MDSKYKPFETCEFETDSGPPGDTIETLVHLAKRSTTAKTSSNETGISTT